MTLVAAPANRRCAVLGALHQQHWFSDWQWHCSHYCSTGVL